MTPKDLNLLQSLLVAKGLRKQKQIAAHFHVSENTVTRWMHGETMTNGAAQRIAEFVGRDVDELFVKKPPATATPPAPAPATVAAATMREQRRAAMLAEAEAFAAAKARVPSEDYGGEPDEDATDDEDEAAETFATHQPSHQ